jgi:beta-galactosidase
MKKKVFPKCSSILHGGDYNPDQWIDRYPEIIEEDMRLMKLANCNQMSMGIFAWAKLEPEEGRFDFDWLDTMMDKIAANKGYVILATPTGARPAWMVQKFPEVLRTNEQGIQNLFGARHNHCFTSPLYREKTTIINTKLAERYKDHPALIMWHLSNEYNGNCHCPLCRQAFRDWLKEKYGNLEELNHSWWNAFWSHTITDWDQINPPSERGEQGTHGMNIDWMRFTTDQTISFIENEKKPLKKLSPHIPITTNLMGTFDGLNYPKIAKSLDLISWDNYPMWKGNDLDGELGCAISFVHDQNRSMLKQPFLLMESTPSKTNWQPYPKLKRPGMHMLSSLQAVAHGSDSVQYFQWRKSRGASEKFHGAVVDHEGSENTREFKDVAELGAVLKQLDPVVGTLTKPEVAVIYDWENKWAINDYQGPANSAKNYTETVIRHYAPFWAKGISVDIIDRDADISGYKMVVAPMLYMVSNEMGERITRFVESGGIFIASYLTGCVNENDLCHLGGFPGPLRAVLGIWAEETDTLYPEDRNSVKTEGYLPGREYAVKDLCDLIHCENARSLGVYGSDFYKGRPALTVNSFGKGKAYYIAARTEQDFLNDFYGKIAEEEGLRLNLKAKLPQGTTVQVRTDGEREFLFLMNFLNRETEVTGIEDSELKDYFTGKKVDRRLVLKAYDCRILERKAHPTDS